MNFKNWKWCFQKKKMHYLLNWILFLSKTLSKKWQKPMCQHRLLEILHQWRIKTHSFSWYLCVCWVINLFQREMNICIQSCSHAVGSKTNTKNRNCETAILVHIYIVYRMDCEYQHIAANIFSECLYFLFEKDICRCGYCNVMFV